MVVIAVRHKVISAMDFPKDCKDCPVWKKSLFREFNQDLVLWVSDKKQTVTLKKKDVLFSQGQDVEGIFCHLSGLAKVVQKDTEGNSPLAAFKKNKKVYLSKPNTRVRQMSLPIPCRHVIYPKLTFCICSPIMHHLQKTLLLEYLQN